MASSVKVTISAVFSMAVIFATAPVLALGSFNNILQDSWHRSRSQDPGSNEVARPLDFSSTNSIQNLSDASIGVDSWLNTKLNQIFMDDEDSPNSKEKEEFPIDQVIAKINTGANSAEGPFDAAMAFDMDLGVFITEHDMMLDYDDVMRKYPNGSAPPESRRKKRALIRDTGLLWDNGVIPYTIETKTFSSQDERELLQVFREWEKYTCIKFVPETRADRYTLKIKDSMGCHSFVGMKKQKGQVVGLKSQCRKRKIMLHEIGHAIGMYHEQARPDRDEYLMIRYENIPPPVKFNFDKINQNETYDYEVPYDYESIMHYGEKAFSKNRQDITMQTKNPFYQKRIGQAERLSYRDVMAVNKMYTCDSHCPSNIVCKETESFIGPNCECWCPTHRGHPEPVRACETTRVEPVVQREPSNIWGLTLPSHLSTLLGRTSAQPTQPPQISGGTRVLSKELSDLLRWRRQQGQVSNFFMRSPSLLSVLSRRLSDMMPSRQPVQTVQTVQHQTRQPTMHSLSQLAHATHGHSGFLFFRK